MVNIALFAAFHTCWGVKDFWWRNSVSIILSLVSKVVFLEVFWQRSAVFRWSLFRIYENRYKLCGIAQRRNQPINLRTSVFLVWEVPTFYHRSIMGLVVCTLYVYHRLSWKKSTRPPMDLASHRSRVCQGWTNQNHMREMVRVRVTEKNPGPTCAAENVSI